MSEKSNGLAKFSKIVAMGALAIVGLSSNAMAADPTWFTTVTDTLGTIPVMIGTVIVAAVSIYMSPVVWTKIKHVIGRA